MSSMFPHKVSIFNKVKDGNKSLYNKSLLDGVLFVKDAGAGRNKLDLNNEDTVSTYIPNTVNSFGKEYIVDKEYETNPAIRGSSYTFAKGDFIGFGDISLDDLSITEYKNKHGNLFEVTSISDFRFGGLPSLVITAK